MEYYNLKKQLKSANNNTKGFLLNKIKDNKFKPDNPFGYFSHSDNDISDKLSDKFSDLEDINKNNENSNILKTKPYSNNNKKYNQDFIKYGKEKNEKKLYNNNTNKDLNQNNNNNNYQNLIKNNNHNYSIIKSVSKSNDTYLNHYINKKNLSMSNRYNQPGKKFEKIKNNKKKKDVSFNDNRDINNNKFKPNHIKMKSYKSVIDNSYDVIDEKIEHKDKSMNESIYDKMNGKFFINKNMNKNIDFTYYNNSKKQSNYKVKNQKNNEGRKTSLNKIPSQNISFQKRSSLNRYKSYNSTSKNKSKSKSSYLYLRNSYKNDKLNNDLDYDNYFSNSHEYFDSNTLNPELRYSGNYINKVYVPVNIGISKKINKKESNFSKTFNDIKDIKHNCLLDQDYKMNQNNETFLRNKIASNSQQKSYQKKLLNKNNIIKNKSNNNINYKKKGLIITIGFDKSNQDFVVHKQANTNSTSNLKATSPIISNSTNNLINIEKTPHEKNDFVRNKVDMKKKISFNKSNNNTISNTKTIFNKNNNIIIPVVKNKIEMKEKNEIRKNKTKFQKKITIYQKRKISNNKYKQPKIKNKNADNGNKNNSLIKNFHTDNKEAKDINYKCIGQNIKKIDFFKAISNDKKNIDKNEYKNKTKDNSVKNEKNSSRSDNSIITNYLKEKKNINKSNIYMKGILKIWKNKAKNITKSIRVKVINQKVVNEHCCNISKYYNYYVKKYKLKNYFLTKRFKVRIPINKICVFSKNIVLKQENNNTIDKKDEQNLINDEIKEKNNISNISINNNDEKLNVIKEEVNNNNLNKNMEIFEEEENENEDFKIEEYEEKHVDSILNLNKNIIVLNNSNSGININNIINQENSRKDNNVECTYGKEDKPKTEAFPLNNSKKRHYLKIEKGLEKLCRIFFRNLEKKNAEMNAIENMNKKPKIKKEKSDSNIKNQSKYSSLFSSTIQKWNDIDKKKYYEKEDMPINNNNAKNKKNKKYKNYAKLLNINKAFSEEKNREQGNIFRCKANLDSQIFLDKNNYKENYKYINKNSEKENIKEKYTGTGMKDLNNNKEEKKAFIINTQKEKYLELLNILSVKNYSNIFEKILNLINNNNNDNIININNYEILLNNQFIFIEVLVDKSIKEKSYMSLYAKLSRDLYFKLLSNFIGLSKKKVKRENLKSIICIQCKQKFDECDVITLINLEKNKFNDKENMYEFIKYKLLGIIDFIYELVNIKMISQKRGLEYLDILHKRIITFDNSIKELENKEYLEKYKHLYIEGEVNILEKLSKIIIERKKPKHVQNFKNFIEDNIISMVENNKKRNEEISNYLICRIINLLEKLRNTELFQNIKQIKIENNDANNNNRDKKEK